MTKPIDVFGDVHGQYHKLLGLLEYLGYSPSCGAFRHPTRTAIFVGDLIDRGPRQVATVELVRAMVAAGSARCILGNHEFNAIAWATPDSQNPGEYLRPHNKPGNRKQHLAFLDEVEGTPQHEEIIGWFKRLPLWMDLGGLRVVHACWHEPSMRAIEPLLGPGNTLTDALIERASRRGDAAFGGRVAPRCVIPR
jgi:calcineurin-like phosphoesterase family protein